MTTQHNFDPKTFFIAAEENFNRRDLACMFFVEKSQLAVEERKPITFFLTGTFLERNETFDITQEAIEISNIPKLKLECTRNGFYLSGLKV